MSVDKPDQALLDALRGQLDGDATLEAQLLSIANRLVPHVESGRYGPATAPAQIGVAAAQAYATLRLSRFLGAVVIDSTTEGGAAGGASVVKVGTHG